MGFGTHLDIVGATNNTLKVASVQASITHTFEVPALEVASVQALTLTTLLETLSTSIVVLMAKARRRS